MNIIDPEPGNWTLTVGSLQNHTVKVTGLSDLHFEHGFSVQPTDKFAETNNRPLSGKLLFDKALRVGTLTSETGIAKTTVVDIATTSVDAITVDTHTDAFLACSMLQNCYFTSQKKIQLRLK